jgi:hypothetical protein
LKMCAVKPNEVVNLPPPNKNGPGKSGAALVP